MKSHLYYLKVSANVKIAMQCFENFGGGKCPKCPPLVARLCSYACLKHDCAQIIAKFFIA